MKSLTHRTAWLYLSIVCVCLLILNACNAPGSKPSPARKLPSSTNVTQIAQDFFNVTSANAEAWNDKDLDAIEAVLTEDIRFIDVSLGDNLTGTNQVMAMARSFCSYFPNLQRKTTDHFIGIEEGIAFYDYWGWKLDRKDYTPEDPFRYIFLLKTRGGSISYWRLFEGLATLEAHFLTEDQSKEFQAVILSYASAWSSTEPKIVAKLYSKDAVRHDSLFEESQQEKKAIKDYATLFFSWYPKATWTPLEMFGERPIRDKPQAIGSSFVIQVSDMDGNDCEVIATVLLQVQDGKIIQEDLYYDPESLIRCGWAE